MNKTESCWLWTGVVNQTEDGKGRHSYGVLSYERKRDYAHRVSWQIHNGPIPPGLFVLHHCDVSLCVRPDHLFIGTAKDNAIDMATKGRAVFQRNPDKAPMGERNGRSKLTASQVLTIRQLRADGHSRQSVAMQFGISVGAVKSITSRQNWSHI